jgi:hypothetical protein
MTYNYSNEKTYPGSEKANRTEGFVFANLPWTTPLPLSASLPGAYSGETKVANNIVE